MHERLAQFIISLFSADIGCHRCFECPPLDESQRLELLKALNGAGITDLAEIRRLLRIHRHHTDEDVLAGKWTGGCLVAHSLVAEIRRRFPDPAPSK